MELYGSAIKKNYMLTCPYLKTYGKQHFSYLNILSIAGG